MTLFHHIYLITLSSGPGAIGDGEPVVNKTSKVMDTLKRKSTVTDDNTSDSAIPQEKTSVSKDLRAMLRTKKSTPFDDN